MGKEKKNNQGMFDNCFFPLFSVFKKKKNSIFKIEKLV